IDRAPSVRCAAKVIGVVRLGPEMAFLCPRPAKNRCSAGVSARVKLQITAVEPARLDRESDSSIAFAEDVVRIATAEADGTTKPNLRCRAGSCGGVLGC